MRLLLLSHFYPPEMGGCAARMHGLAKWLVRFGHDVTVVTGFPNYPSGRIDPIYRGKFRHNTDVEGVNLVCTWVYTTPKHGKLRRLMNYFSFVLSSLLIGIFSRRSYDAIVVTSPPLFLGISGWLISFIRRTPWVLDIRDIWPDVGIEGGQLQPGSFMVRWGSKLERFLYRRATHITVVTEAKKHNVANKVAVPDKISIVENGVDLDLFEQVLGAPEMQADFRTANQLENTFLVSYAGLFGLFQGLGVVLRAAKQLLSEPNIHFLLIGEGPERNELVAYAQRHRLHNVTFLPVQSREKLLPLIATSDAMLVPLVNDQVVDAVPSKLLEAWGCKKGVVYIGSGEAETLVKRSQGGVVIEPGSPQKIADILNGMNNKSIDYSAWGEMGYQFVADHFERSLLARKMERVCECLSQNQNKIESTLLPAQTQALSL